MTILKLRLCLPALLTCFALLELLVFAAKPPQLNPEWKRYTAEREEFSVMCPTPLAGFISNITKVGKMRIERSYSAYADGVVYIILSYDKLREGESINDIVNEFKRHHLFGGEMNHERDVKISNIAGRQYRLKWKEARGLVQIFLTEKRAYVIEAVSAEESNPLVERFLLSLTIDNQSPNQTNTRGDAAVTASMPPGAPAQPPSIPIDNSNTVYKASEVIRKAVLVLRPEPTYTEEARQKNIKGTVVLRAVLSSSGNVMNITSVKELPGGLTEKAIQAALHLRFIPAMKDGQFVSQDVRLEYNFGMY